MTRMRRILLIDDNPGDARMVVEFLKGDGYAADFEQVESLAAGLELLARGGLDVVLLDLGLPDSGGIDTYLAVQQAAPALPVIVLTGSADGELAAEAVHRGAPRIGPSPCAPLGDAPVGGRSRCRARGAHASRCGSRRESIADCGLRDRTKDSGPWIGVRFKARTPRECTGNPRSGCTHRAAEA